MIYIDSIESVSDLIRNRAAAMWVVKTRTRGDRLTFRVCPFGKKFKHVEKTKRRVIVDLEDQSLTCADWYSDMPCQANAPFVIGTGESKRPKLCSHGLAVLWHLGIIERREAA